MSGQRLEIIYALNVISHFDAWQVIFEFLIDQGVHPSTPVNFYEKNIPLDKINQNLKKSNRPNFQIEWERNIFGYGAVTAWNHVLIWVESKSESKVFNWDQLVEAFLSKASFVQARISDIEYEFWQNAKDPIEYRANNRSFAGLPMKSNGLPPPLEQQEIDTSQNPGRRIIRNGFIEAVGSIVWLSEEFWKRTGVDKEKIKEVFSNEYEIINQNILRLQVSSEPFNSIESVELQKTLRKLLFNVQE